MIAARPGERDLPPLAHAVADRARQAVADGADPARPPAERRSASATGSIAGQGALTLDVTDFPYAWYLRQVLQKVEEALAGPESLERASPEAAHLRRDPAGRLHLRRLVSSRRSGSTLYDQRGAPRHHRGEPVPAAPQDWAKPSPHA